MVAKMTRLKNVELESLISTLAKEFAGRNGLVCEYRATDTEDVWFLIKEDGDVERILQIAVFEMDFGRMLTFTPGLNGLKDKTPLPTKPATISIETPVAMLCARGQSTGVHPRAGIAVTLHLKNSWALTLALVPATPLENPSIPERPSIRIIPEGSNTVKVVSKNKK